MKTDITFDEWFASCFNVLISEDSMTYFGGLFFGIAGDPCYDLSRLSIKIRCGGYEASDAANEINKSDGLYIIGYGDTLEDVIKMIKDKAKIQRNKILSKMGLKA